MPDDSAHTVNAAAVVLAAAARSTRGLHHRNLDHRDCTAATTPGWWSRLKAKLLCFRAPHGRPLRIADASPEPVPRSSSHSHYARHAPQPAVASFVAPPSSPASSVLTSESPSPVRVLRLDASSCYSSPTASIFAIGPYAREPQQLVSPPAFSGGATEPSTAPLTPPPESTCSLHLGTTSASSPEVPFARFLPSSFHANQLQPGSPIGGTLVSPASTSSSPPPAWTHRRNEGSLLDGGRIPEAMVSSEARSSEEGGSSARRKENDKSGEFVFGNAAGEWTAFAAGEGSSGGGRRASISISIGNDAVEGGNQQWPFFSSFPN